MSGGYLSGGICPVGICPVGICPDTRTQQYTVDRLSSTAFTVFAAVKLGVAYNFLGIDFIQKRKLSR